MLIRVYLGLVFAACAVAAALFLVPADAATHPGAKVGLGPILSTADGGQIFGFDINQKGNDGVLATSQTIDPNGLTLVSMETFDATTGKITKVFNAGKTKNGFVMDGIFNGDTALVTHYDFPLHGLFPIRHYEIMHPVTAERITGKWTPPIFDIDIVQSAVNQDTATSLVYAIELKNNDIPDLVISNVAGNTFSKIIHLDPNVFSQQNGVQLAQDTVKNQAVMVSSPSFGAVGGPPTIIATVDLATGKVTQFRGVGPGDLFGSGFPNGIAMDSRTGIACTTTELDAGVEFYDVAKQAGLRVRLPNFAGQLQSGRGIANDPIHRLFLVTQPVSSIVSSGSSIVVYDENGNVVEAINGFQFPISGPGISINPTKRTGWVSGPGFNQLQSFSY